MRKIVMLNRVSLDGFFAGPNGEIDWFVPDPEVDRATHEMMRPDTLLLGRVTYQMFVSIWPNVAKDPNAPAGAKKLAGELSQMTKVVFSKSLGEVTWENTRLVAVDVVREIKQLKEGTGADITIFGSGSIVQQLVAEGLMDEYLVILTPAILGTGKQLFKDVKKTELKLLAERRFTSGNVLLHYAAG